MQQLLKSKQWLVMFTMFTLMWTGTLLHDFFGLEVLSHITKLAVAAQDYAPECKRTRMEQNPCNAKTAEQLPCSCPTHVHSPCCLVKAKQLSPTVWLVVRLLCASISPNALPVNCLIPSRDPPRIIAKKSVAALYIANRSLLI
ncbi:MAG: hypothetical protein K2Z81_20715 [Cyanobacteria bacterium]|nr:hypothetical protein [Cyanobacteriota bacterium]